MMELPILRNPPRGCAYRIAEFDAGDPEGVMMRTNSFQIVGGGVLIGLGALFLLGSFTGINMWAFVGPLVLIGLGLWVMTRQPRRMPGMEYHDRFIGEFKRDGAWQVQDEHFSLLIGDVNLDLTRAKVPAGVTTLRMTGFVGDIDVVVPANVGVKLKTSAVAADVQVAGQKDEILFGSTELTTPNYASTERRIDLVTEHFAGDVKVRQVGGV